MKIIKNLSFSFLLAIVYFLIFQLNSYLFSASVFSSGVNWIYLPSGLRLVFVLIFIDVGAIGVGLSTLAIACLYYLQQDWVTIAGASLISGLAPLCARRVCIRLFKMDPNLQNLSAPALLKIVLVFALVSPVMHQLWLTWRGETANFWISTAVMAIGDFVGALLVLYAIKFFLPRVPGTAEKFLI